MQVFKSYFKVLNKYKGFIIMYICIFSGVLSAMIASTSKKGEGFVSKQCKVAIFDYDESAVSQALVDYLTEQHLMNKKLKDDKTEIQDAIYNMDIDVVLRIEEGFGERLKAGDAAQSL
ncbi:MAG: ABC transporter permease, partial [Wujia sp.]